MRLLFAHPGALALGNHHGAVKSYRALAAALCGRGHDCEIVTVRPPGDCDSEAWERLSSIERAPGTPNRLSVTATRAVYEAASEMAGVRHAVRGLRNHAEFYALLRRRIAEVAPDWVVCENGTVSTRVLRALAGPRLVLSVSTTASLPFGPRSAAPSRFAASAAAYRRIRKIFCASRFIAAYLREHAGIDAVVQPQIAYGRGPFETLGRFDGAVTMVNPAAHKGGAIFAALARHFPDRRFRAVESYARSVPELRTLPNVHFVPADEDVSVVLAGASLLVVPSL